MSKQIIFLLGIFCALALSACATATPVAPPPAPTAAPAAAFPLTITDDAGRTVTIKAEPKRVVSLAPSNTETIYALGKGATVVGVTQYCNYPPEAKEKPQVGGFAKIDLEKVVGLSPDLVLATNLHAKSVVPELEKRGLVVVVVEPKNVSEVVTKMATFGKLLGASAAATQLSAQMQSRIDAVTSQVVTKMATFGKLLGASAAATQLSAQMQSRIDAVTSQVATAKTKPRVFYEIDASLYTPGPGSFIDDLLSKAGGANIAADAKGAYVQLSAEVILAKDPEVILLGDMLFGETPEKLKARAGWSNLTAVKTNRVVPIANEDVVARPGPRIVEGLELVARALYPDLFK